MESWKVLDEEIVFEAAPFIQVSRQRIELPGGRVVPHYYRLKIPDAALVYAQTPSGEVIVIRSYRHGAGRVCMTFPGGNIAPGEESLAAAQRELLEETGYAAPEWEAVGGVFANANHRGQALSFFRARGCRPVASPNSDDLEESRVVLLTTAQLERAVRQGEFPFAGQLALFALATGTAR
jgi:ADP-ribose pyrophosphatase